jgi:hypothetical protein
MFRTLKLGVVKKILPTYPLTQNRNGAIIRPSQSAKVMIAFSDLMGEGTWQEFQDQPF